MLRSETEINTKIDAPIRIHKYSVESEEDERQSLNDLKSEKKRQLLDEFLVESILQDEANHNDYNDPFILNQDYENEQSALIKRIDPRFLDYSTGFFLFI